MMSRLRPSSGSELVQVESFTGRKKVTLSPGHSLMDWIRVGRNQGDLSGVGPNKLDITAGQLAVHNTQKDLWMAIRGKVYNLTPYLEFHPGGIDELMRAAGKDGTDLFDEIHNWVNVESMLEKCLVGYLVLDATSKAPGVKKVRSKSVVSSGSTKPSVSSPSHDFYQTKTEVIVVIYSKWEDMRHDLVIVNSMPEELIIESFIKDYNYFIHVKPAYPLRGDCSVKVSPVGKVEVTFVKEDATLKWENLGTPLRLHESYLRRKNIDCKYRLWTVVSNTTVTHDTWLIKFRAPTECRMLVPVGYHVHIKADISGMELARSYTAVVPSLTSPFSDPSLAAGKSIYLMVKLYKGGAISPCLTSLKPGDKVQMSNFDGNFDLKRLSKTSHLVMFAAGTGFTSMVTLIVHSLFVLKDKSFPVKLVFYNKTMKDILWQDQLEQLTKLYSRFSVTHVLSQETDVSWKGMKGRVSMEHVKEFVPTPEETPNPLFCICGQWAYNDAVESFGRLNGLQDEHIYVFSQAN